MNKFKRLQQLVPAEEVGKERTPGVSPQGHTQGYLRRPRADSEKVEKEVFQSIACESVAYISVNTNVRGNAWNTKTIL